MAHVEVSGYHDITYDCAAAAPRACRLSHERRSHVITYLCTANTRAGRACRRRTLRSSAERASRGGLGPPHTTNAFERGRRRRHASASPFAGGRRCRGCARTGPRVDRPRHPRRGRRHHCGGAGRGGRGFLLHVKQLGDMGEHVLERPRPAAYFSHVRNVDFKKSSQVKNYSPVYMKQNTSKKHRGLPIG